jgi:hypothetical protein
MSSFKAYFFFHAKMSHFAMKFLLCAGSYVDHLSVAIERRIEFDNKRHRICYAELENRMIYDG